MKKIPFIPLFFPSMFRKVINHNTPKVYDENGVLINKQESSSLTLVDTPIITPSTPKSILSPDDDSLSDDRLYIPQEEPEQEPSPIIEGKKRGRKPKDWSKK